MAEYEKKYMELSKYTASIIEDGIKRCKQFEGGLQKEIQTPVTASLEWLEFSKLVEAAIAVKKSLAKKTSGEKIETRISENSTLNLSINKKEKQESKKFTPAVSSGRISKASSGIGIGCSEHIIRAEQLGESMASVSRKPWCSGCNFYNLGRCFGNANICYNF